MAIWKTTWRSHYDDGTLVSNGLHWVSQPAGGMDDATADTIRGIIDTALTDAYLNCLPTELNLDLFEVSQILPHDSTDVPDGAVQVFSDTHGSLSPGDSVLPNGLAATLSLRTGVSRRWARGYMSLPCPLSSSYLTEDGQWGGTFRSLADDFADMMDDDYEWGSFPVGSIIPVVYSRTRELLVGIDEAWAQVQGGILRAKPTWRRSRTTSP